MKWVALVGGFAWPFAVAAVGVALTAPGVELSDGLAYLLFAAGFVGVPAAVAGAALWMPRSWPGWTRVALALAVATPLALGAVYLGLIAYVVGYIVAGGYVPC